MLNALAFAIAIYAHNGGTHCYSQLTEPNDVYLLFSFQFWFCLMQYSFFSFLYILCLLLISFTRSLCACVFFFCIRFARFGRLVFVLNDSLNWVCVFCFSSYSLGGSTTTTKRAFTVRCCFHSTHIILFLLLAAKINREYVYRLPPPSALRWLSRLRTQRMSAFRCTFCLRFFFFL